MHRTVPTKSDPTPNVSSARLSKAGRSTPCAFPHFSIQHLATIRLPCGFLYPTLWTCQVNGIIHCVVFCESLLSLSWWFHDCTMSPILLLASHAPRFRYAPFPFAICLMMDWTPSELFWVMLLWNPWTSVCTDICFCFSIYRGVI